MKEYDYEMSLKDLGKNATFEIIR